MTQNINFIDKFKNIRKSRGLTQQQVAELCGISQVQVTRYENGINKPTKRILTKICKGLNVPIEYFDNTFGVSDDVLDAEYKRAKEALVDPEDKMVLSKFLQGIYLLSQSKLVVKESGE